MPTKAVRSAGVRGRECGRGGGGGGGGGVRTRAGAGCGYQLYTLNRVV
jgi:hypothetical protein